MMFDFIQDLWAMWRYGPCVGSMVAVTQARREEGLQIQRDTIAAGLNCRVRIVEDSVEINGADFEIDDNTMIVVSEFEGGVFGPPTDQIYTLTFSDRI